MSAREKLKQMLLDDELYTIERIEAAFDAALTEARAQGERQGREAERAAFDRWLAAQPSPPPSAPSERCQACGGLGYIDDPDGGRGHCVACEEAEKDR